VVLARYHYYDGTTIFRTAQSIGIVQGGAPHTNSTTDPGPGYDLPDEGFDYASLAASGSAVGGPYKYSPGDLVMARSGRPNGGSAQFFFAVNDATSALDSQGVYVKFGTTTQGLDLLQTFLSSEPSETPAHPVTINTVTITET
jgi:cyclophilin family peptidyl-prolyl cis-trans isomerase